MGRHRSRSASPPSLDGYSYVRPLGVGGFAQVLLYEEDMPRRGVAVKVMDPATMDAGAIRLFTAEANAMARVSSHPCIVTIFTASVAPDGRPYIVMEYCPSSYGSRYRQPSSIPSQEVLRIGVRIGGALETVHQAGMLHRDITPSNILVNSLGAPALSDFGIAVTLTEPTGPAMGMSVPWSAPEVISETTMGTVRSEVYSLAATLATLLSGHSPAHVVGGSNTRVELAQRILRGRIAPVTRADVPVALRTVLLRALSRDPDRRQGSAAELVADLQEVEASLGLPVTAADMGVLR